MNYLNGTCWIFSNLDKGYYWIGIACRWTKEFDLGQTKEFDLGQGCGISWIAGQEGMGGGVIFLIHMGISKGFGQLE